MDDEDKKPTEGPNKKPKTETVVHLTDGQVGETETDECDPLSNNVYSELPSTSQHSSSGRQKLKEAKALVKGMIDSILPKTESNDTEIGIKEELTNSQEQLQQKTSHLPMRYDDERLNRILQLLDRYTRNLEAIEEHVLGVSREAHLSSIPLQSKIQLETSAELQMTKQCEFATQTMPLNTLRVDVTNTIRPKGCQRFYIPQQNQQHQLQQSQQLANNIPPCERRHHTILISSNGSAAHPPQVQHRTMLGRIGQTLGDFAAACCLCLQVNKDCVFCLGFFIAFVISASFLTAFFYRTINLTTSPLHGPVGGKVTQAPANELPTIRFNGGYYYIYNSHRQHFV